MRDVQRMMPYGSVPPQCNKTCAHKERDAATPCNTAEARKGALRLSNSTHPVPNVRRTMADPMRQLAEAFENEPRIEERVMLPAPLA